MPRFDKSLIKPGMFLTADGGPVIFASSGGPSSVSRDREKSVSPVAPSLADVGARIDAATVKVKELVEQIRKSKQR